MLRVFACFICVWSSALSAEVLAGNSERGERLFETQQCVRCHSINGRNGGTAPDLGRTIGRNFAPELLATTLWNHAPAMWSAMERHSVPIPRFTMQDAADLFAYFYSTRFFDEPGDAARGKSAFSRHACSECHGLTERKTDSAPAVATWQSLQSPTALAEAMWNHAGRMREEFAQRGLRWPVLTSQELTDILVYLRNHPSIPRRQARFELASGTNGEALLRGKRCLNCHQGNLALGPRLRRKTIDSIAAAMWNHAPKMINTVETFKPGEMRTLISYLWAKQLFENSGNVARGRKAFRKRSCSQCHEQGQAPKLTGEFNVVRMTSALWSHGPTMLKQMKSQGVRWPRFNSTDMPDIIAYLNSRR